MDFSRLIVLDGTPCDAAGATRPRCTHSPWQRCLAHLPGVICSLLLCGCSISPPDLLTEDVADDALSPSPRPELASGSKQPRRFLRTNRYSLTDTRPTKSQAEPLSSHVSVNFGEGVQTVGDALFELLRGSGYRVFYDDFHACRLSKKLLFARELPLSLRSLGPVSLGDALDTVIGKAWETRVSELDRTLSFHVRDEYGDQTVDLNTSWTVADFEPDRRSHSRFSIAFNTGEFHAPSHSAHGLIEEAAARAKTVPAHVLVRGHAHSSGNWATEAQALRRAKTVQNLLIDHGVDPGTIRLATSVSNNNDPLRQLPNGVELVLYPSVHNRAPAELAGLDCTSAHGRANPTEHKHSAANLVFAVRAGSLRRNIERLLRALGLRMGKWDLADGRYEYDWEIPHGYTIPVTTPDQAMRSLLGSYGIQPVLNLLDSSVDFVMHHKSISANP